MRKNDEYDSDNEEYIKWLNKIYSLTFVDGKNSKEKIRVMVKQEIAKTKGEKV